MSLKNWNAFRAKRCNYLSRSGCTNTINILSAPARLFARQGLWTFLCEHGPEGAFSICACILQGFTFVSVPVYYRALNFFVYEQDKTGPFVSVPVYYRASRGVVNCFSKLQENKLFEFIILEFLSRIWFHAISAEPSHVIWLQTYCSLSLTITTIAFIARQQRVNPHD